MTHQTFIVICGILIGVPFLVACIKGNPFIGIVVGVVSAFVMSLAAGQGVSMLGVHAVGFVIAGLGIAWALHDN